MNLNGVGVPWLLGSQAGVSRRAVAWVSEASTVPGKAVVCKSKSHRWYWVRTK